jgi:predicted enzyme involved in methoxymalonyl-ACP biosynthesis
VNELDQRGAKVLTGRYVPTQKNVLVKDLYSQHGFAQAAVGEFRAELADITPKPDYVTVR